MWVSLFSMSCETQHPAQHPAPPLCVPSTADASLLSCMQGGNYRAALRRFGDLRKQGLQPSARTYTALLNACAKAGQLKVARKLFATMHSLQLKPTVQAHTALMDACVNKATPESYKEAFQVRESAAEVQLDCPPGGCR